MRVGAADIWLLVPRGMVRAERRRRRIWTAARIQQKCPPRPKPRTLTAGWIRRGVETAADAQSEVAGRLI